MTGPRRPDDPLGDLDRPIDPDRPIRDRPPILRPIPWTPFGPGDNATPDVDAIVKRADRTRRSLEKAQLELTRMRHGPGPDNTPPVVREVSRADGLWPFLLIRQEVGDVGVRPMPESERLSIAYGARSSPDILLAPVGLPDEPYIVDRDTVPAFKARIESQLVFGDAYDIWVHVWNLGQVPATGVRVRVYLPEVGAFVGGRQLDLGDRLSPTCHRLVKAATYRVGAFGEAKWTAMIAVAECLADVASGDRSPGMDRHCAQRSVFSPLA